MIRVSDPALAALAQAYGTGAGALAHFAGGREDSDGEIFSYPYEDRRRLLKILVFGLEDSRKGLFRFEERLRFVRFVGERGARVVFPQVSPAGRLYETAEDGGRLWVGYAMESAPGQTPSSREWNPAFFQAWGRAVGGMHRLAQAYPTWRAAVDPHTGEAALTWQEEIDSFIPMCAEQDVRERWGQMRARLERLPVERASFGFCHNDPHLWNLLWDGAALTILDFDVANCRWFASDIAVACQSVLFDLTGGLNRPLSDRARLVGFLSAFLKGYRQEQPIDPGWIDRLDLFIAYRRLLLYTVMQGWLGGKPEMKAAWKRMILDEPPVLGAVSSSLA